MKSDSTRAELAPGRVVYIGLRVYDMKAKRARNCCGLNVRAFGFTPQEVHDIVITALRAAALDYQRKTRAKELLDGTSDGRQC